MFPYETHLVTEIFHGAQLNDAKYTDTNQRCGCLREQRTTCRKLWYEPQIHRNHQCFGVFNLFEWWRPATSLLFSDLANGITHLWWHKDVLARGQGISRPYYLTLGICTSHIFLLITVILDLEHLVFSLAPNLTNVVLTKMNKQWIQYSCTRGLFLADRAALKQHLHWKIWGMKWRNLVFQSPWFPLITMNCSPLKGKLETTFRDKYSIIRG